MDQLKQAKAGRPVPEEEIPPAVSASAATSRPAAPPPVEDVSPPTPQGWCYPLNGLFENVIFLLSAITAY